MFDRTAHLRALSADPAIVARRNAAIRVHWTPEMDAALVELSRTRLGIIPIARKIGVAKSVARRRRNELGLSKGRPPGPCRREKPEPGSVIVRLIA